MSNPALARVYPIGYNTHVRDPPDGGLPGWMRDLRDAQGRAVIARRVQRMAAGNFGDHKFVGDKVSELRVPVGPGYRVYYTLRGRDLVVLLCGGDKDSQRRDIARAKELAAQLE